LHSLCAKNDNDGKEQLIYYTKGVGTTRGEIIAGGIFGSGISTLIVDAYEWLIPRYCKDDEIFIFGFSRGAYAARSLAGLIAKSGIIQLGSPVGVGELYERYKDPKARSLYALIDQNNSNSLGDVSILERWLLEHSIQAPITMVGVWDTVGALVGKYSYLETGLRLPIKNAYHALAIDEHRMTFKPTLYTQNFHLNIPSDNSQATRDISSVEQRWFVGAHANVGGGYNSDLLTQIPLRWLKMKAEAHGMKFVSELDMHDESYLADINNSYKEMLYGAYYYATLGNAYYRIIGAPKINTGAVETVTVNETIDKSVFERARRIPDYRPRNLSDWADRKGVKLDHIETSVRADDPAVIVE